MPSLPVALFIFSVFPSTWECEQRFLATVWWLWNQSQNRLSAPEHDCWCAVSEMIPRIDQLVEKRELHPPHWDCVFVLSLKISSFGWHLFQWYSLNVRDFYLWVLEFSSVDGGGARKLHETKKWYARRWSLGTAASCFRTISPCCLLFILQYFVTIGHSHQLTLKLWYSRV